MTSALRSRRHIAHRIGLFIALTTFGVAGCTKIHYLYPRNLQGFVLPSGCPTGSAPSTNTELNACLDGIEFDTAEFVGDEQRLMVVDSGPGTGLPCAGDPTHTCRYGPLAKVEPVKGAEMYSDAALAEGRIIARMYLGPMETDSYPKFGLVPRDTTYWWVSTAQDTSLFLRRSVGMARGLAKRGRGLTRTPHPRGSFQQSFARWVWDPADEKANGACGPACCKPQ